MEEPADISRMDVISGVFADKTDWKKADEPTTRTSNEIATAKAQPLASAHNEDALPEELRAVGHSVFVQDDVGGGATSTDPPRLEAMLAVRGVVASAPKGAGRDIAGRTGSHPPDEDQSWHRTSEGRTAASVWRSPRLAQIGKAAKSWMRETVDIPYVPQTAKSTDGSDVQHAYGDHLQAEHEMRLTTACLRAHPAFALSPQDLRTLAYCGRRLHMPRYREAFQEGALAHHFFILLAGTMVCTSEVTRDETVLSVQGGATSGICFGTEALTRKSLDMSERSPLRRLYTIAASSDSVVLRFSVSDLMAAMPSLSFERLVCTHFEHYARSELKQVPIFDSLDPEAMDTLAPLFELEDHGRKDETIFDDGDAGDRLYILVKGEVGIVKGGKTLARLNADVGMHHAKMRPFFGEMALIDGKPRMAAAVSCTPCTLLVLKQEAFARLFATVPDFEARLKGYKTLRARESELVAGRDLGKRHQLEAAASSARVTKLLHGASMSAAFEQRITTLSASA